ncbi:MAG: DegT/DnrJ/EryC1/StrS family aminotransferase, partial [Desulfosudaceae bacterium]
ACRNRATGRRIAACLPMHTFGHPCRIEEIAAICQRYNIPLIEDAAESLGSTYQGRTTGTFGLAGVYSFNGNKIITAGGGGAIVTDEEEFARRAKHLTTTAKIPHSYFYGHDTLGYNYRLPNLNAALACAQLENLEFFLANKRELAGLYSSFFAGHPTIKYMPEPEGSRSNYWLNTVLLPDKESRDTFLEETNQAKVLTRPAWNLLNTLPMCRECQTDGIKNARWLGARLVNLPSSVRL